MELTTVQLPKREAIILDQSGQTLSIMLWSYNAEHFCARPGTIVAFRHARLLEKCMCGLPNLPDLHSLSVEKIQTWFLHLIVRLHVCSLLCQQQPSILSLKLRSVLHSISGIIQYYTLLVLTALRQLGSLSVSHAHKLGCSSLHQVGTIRVNK